MNHARVAVLGASGLIGAAVVSRLALQGEVLRVSRRPGGDLAVDLAAPDEAILRALRDVDAVVHCAGVTDEEFAADRGRAWMRASEATARLAELVRAAGIARFVYVSTAHVYGPLRGPITERSAPDPRSDYAIAHFTTEQIFRRAGFAGGVVRPCAVFGDPCDLARFARWSLVPFAFPRMAVEAGEIVLTSPGFQRRNFVAAAVVADAIAALLAGEARWRVINPVGASTLAIRAFADLVAACASRVTGTPCRVTSPVAASTSREAPFTYLSENGTDGGDDALPAWTEGFIRRLMDARTHVSTRRLASA